MLIENEQQKKALDSMENERRLKLGRELAKAITPFIWLNMALAMTVWLWNSDYIQFLGYAILLIPAAVLPAFQSIFERMGRAALWANFFSLYLIFLLIAIPFFVSEVLLASMVASAIIFFMVGLLSGTRQLLVVVGISIIGFVINVLFGRYFASTLFLPLNEVVSLISSIALGIFAISATGVIFYLVLNGQEKLYRQAQLAKIESEQAKAVAEEASRAKSAFLANTSHELRTPLNAILGFSQIMARDSALNSTHRESIEIINRNGEHLLGLINNVLDMAKIESGHIHLQERSFDLYKMIETIASMFRLRANSKGLSLSVEYASDVPIYVQMDDGKLRQALINLLGNAVKFTAMGGIILRVSQSKTADFLHFEVEDTGPGIAPEELVTLFEPFSQTASGRQTGEGTGLGLPISRQFVRLLGGDLTLSSQPGEGSLFSFDVLARSLNPSEMSQINQIKPRVIGLAAEQPAHRLLIVEDQADSRLLLVGLLSAVGFQVQTANNGREAIAIWQDWHPHLIWMDMRMPIMNGHEATKAIRALPGGQATIIIALSASSFIEDHDQILADGCNDFICKPYRQDEIFDALARHLRVRFVYENGVASQGQAAPLDFSGLPISWLLQLQKAALEADAEKIHELARQISRTHPIIAERTIHLSANFAYEAIISAIAPAKESYS